MLRCRNVSVTYPGADAPSLKDVSLGVQAGDALGVAGCSGAGKSTLLGCMSGWIIPNAGSVEADGVSLDASADGRRAFRKLVGCVHQLPEEQLFARTVSEDVAFGPRNLGLTDDQVDERVAWALEAVGLDVEGFGERNPFALSGGEARRVAIAGILALQPRYLLLDEPTAGLDPRERRRLLRFIAQLADEGMGVVIVSHDIEALAQHCSRALLLADGRVISSGDARLVLGDANRLRAAGLVPPARVELANRLRRRGLSVPWEHPDGTAGDAFSPEEQS